MARFAGACADQKFHAFMADDKPATSVNYWLRIEG